MSHILEVEPGTYPLHGVVRTVVVGRDGVARFELFGRQWGYRLVDSARGVRSEDAEMHIGTASERETARTVGTMALLHAWKMRERDRELAAA